jgi:hypothetical protein
MIVTSVLVLIVVTIRMHCRCHITALCFGRDITFFTSYTGVTAMIVPGSINRPDNFKIWSFHGDYYEECRLLGYKTPFRTSQEAHYVSATVPSRLLPCKIWGFHGVGYAECHILGYKNPVRSLKNVVSWDVSPSSSCKNRYVLLTCS